MVLFPCHWTESECVGTVTCSSTPGTGELPQNWTNHHSVVGLQYMSGVEGLWLTVLFAQNASSVLSEPFVFLGGG